MAWLGRIAYRRAWALQEELRARILGGEAVETILLVEHPRVVTLGRHADRRHLLLDEAGLAAQGIELVTTSRGGDVTYHGPGQLVAYPIVRVHQGVAAYVAALAEAVVAVVGGLGVAATYRADRPGVWVGSRKLAAFGVHIRHGVALHGLALNVENTSGDFAPIVPCGLRDAGVTSLRELLDPAPKIDDLLLPLGEGLARALDRPLDPARIQLSPEPAMAALQSPTRSVEWASKERPAPIAPIVVAGDDGR